MISIRTILKRYYNHNGDIIPAITEKNLPDKLYMKLKRRAKENRRSINNEIINSLEESFGVRKIDVDKLLAETGKQNYDALITIGINFKDGDISKNMVSGVGVGNTPMMKEAIIYSLSETLARYHAQFRGGKQNDR